MVEVRPYKTEDYRTVKEILELGELYWEVSDNEKALGRKISEHPDSIIVAVEKDRVVGTNFIVEDFMPFLFRLAVHPDYRGKGIGMQLMHKGEEILKSKGYDHANILVSENDTDLQNLYEKQGYKKGRTWRWMVKNL